MVETLADSPWWIDAWLIGMVALAAGGQYVALVFDGGSVPRWLLAAGWTGLLVRFAIAAYYGQALHIPLISAVCLMLVAGGTALLEWERIVRAMEPQVWCMRDPHIPYSRRDRIEAEIRRLKEKHHA